MRLVSPSSRDDGGVPAAPGTPRPHSLALQQQDEEEVNISQESSEEEQ